MTLDELKELMETGEEFELNENIARFRFNKKTRMLEHITPQKIGNIKQNLEWCESNVYINYLLSETLIRKPWKPKVGDKVWCWVLYYDGDTECVQCTFNGCDIGFARIAFDNCFRTKEECESHTEIRDKLVEMRKEYV